MSLYSDGIIFKFRFQKSRFTPKNRDRPDIYSSQCINKVQNDCKWKEFEEKNTFKNFEHAQKFLSISKIFWAGSKFFGWGRWTEQKF